MSQLANTHTYIVLQTRWPLMSESSLMLYLVSRICFIQKDSASAQLEGECCSTVTVHQYKYKQTKLGLTSMDKSKAQAHSQYKGQGSKRGTIMELLFPTPTKGFISPVLSYLAYLSSHKNLRPPNAQVPSQSRSCCLMGIMCIAVRLILPSCWPH